MKNVIFLKKDIPQNIKRQVRIWDLYAKLSPIIFFIIGWLCHDSGMLTLQQIIWIGGGLFTLTAVCWWFWTVYTIGHITDRVHKAETGIQEVLGDLKVVKELLKQIKNK